MGDVISVTMMFSLGALHYMEWDGVYKHDGGHFTFPLSEQEQSSLIEQGVPESFTADF